MQTRCETIEKHVDTLVDGELDPRSALEFDEHLAGCMDCHALVALRRSMKRSLQLRCSAPIAAPADFRARLEAQLRQAQAARDAAVVPVINTASATAGVLAQEELVPVSSASVSRRPLFALRNPFAARAGASRSQTRGARASRVAIPAAALAAFAYVVPQGSSDTQTADSTSPIFSEVVRKHSSAYPVEVAGQAPQVAGWLRERLQIPVHTVAFPREPQATLVGARLSNVREREAAALYYDVGGQRVTVLVFRRPANYGNVRMETVAGRSVYLGHVRRHRVPVVEHGGLTYAFTGDIESERLVRLAAMSNVNND